MTGFSRIHEVLKAVKERRRPDMTWDTTCRIYAELRGSGCLEKKGKRHELTAKGQRLLEILEEE